MAKEDQPTVEHVDHFMHILDFAAVGDIHASQREGGRGTENMDMAAVVALLEDQLQVMHLAAGYVGIVITQDIKRE